MKKLLYSFLAILFCLACASEETLDRRTSHVVLDITNKNIEIGPSDVIADIQKSMKIQTDYKGSATIYFHTVDELSSDRAAVAELTADEKGNSIVRKKEIESFQKEIEDQVKKYTRNMEGKESSKIYAKLCAVLKQTQPGEDILIYSDLLENSELARFYKPDELDKVHEAPLEYYQKHLSSFCELPALQGRTIWLYPLRTSQTDAMISKAERFWKSVLEDKGATVRINAL